MAGRTDFYTHYDSNQMKDELKKYLRKIQKSSFLEGLEFKYNKSSELALNYDLLIERKN